MSLYISMIIVFLSRVGVWDITLLKDTAFWFLFTGIVIFIKAVTEKNKYQLFRNLTSGLFKVIVLIEFIVNFYCFSFVIELLFVPILVIIGSLDAFTKGRPEYREASKFLSWLQVLLSFFLIGHFFYNFVLGYSPDLVMDNLNKFALPILLTFMFIPFIYLSVVIATYEELFLRVNIIFDGREHLKNITKMRIFLECFMDLNLLHEASQKVGLKIWGSMDERELGKLLDSQFYWGK